MKIQALDLVVDLNHDGRYSGWELWETIKFLYRLPGNLITEALGHIPYVSSTLDIHASEATGYGSLDGLLAVTLSLIFWVLVVFGLLTLASPDKDEDIDMANATTSAVPPVSMGLDGDQAVVREGNPTPGHAAAIDGVPAGPRGHLPVSRPLYAAPGKRPKRRRSHHFVHSLIRPAK